MMDENLTQAPYTQSYAMRIQDKSGESIEFNFDTEKLVVSGNLPIDQAAQVFLNWIEEGWPGMVEKWKREGAREVLDDINAIKSRYNTSIRILLPTDMLDQLEAIRKRHLGGEN
jgi:hypothetical protein